MDHIVCLDAMSKEMENLINGTKSMIIRGAEERKLPHGSVNVGDILYFVNSNGECKVKAKGVVCSVLNCEKLTVEESFETIIQHQDKLQLPDNQFDKVAGKSYLVFVGLEEIEEVKPFRIDSTCFAGIIDWIPVGKIETVTFPNRTAEVADR